MTFEFELNDHTESLVFDWLDLSGIIIEKDESDPLVTCLRWKIKTLVFEIAITRGGTRLRVNLPKIKKSNISELFRLLEEEGSPCSLRN